MTNLSKDFMSINERLLNKDVMSFILNNDIIRQKRINVPYLRINFSYYAKGFDKFENETGFVDKSFLTSATLKLNLDFFSEFIIQEPLFINTNLDILNRLTRDLKTGNDKFSNCSTLDLHYDIKHSKTMFGEFDVFFNFVYKLNQYATLCFKVQYTGFTNSYTLDTIHVNIMSKLKPSISIKCGINPCQSTISMDNVFTYRPISHYDKPFTLQHRVSEISKPKQITKDTNILDLFQFDNTKITSKSKVNDIANRMGLDIYNLDQDDFNSLMMILSKGS